MFKIGDINNNMSKRSAPCPMTKKSEEIDTRSKISEMEEETAPVIKEQKTPRMEKSTRSTASGTETETTISEENINIKINNKRKEMENPEEPLDFEISPLTSHMLKLFNDDIMSANFQAMGKQRTSQCLKHHNINGQLRGRMVDWMIEVLTLYGCANETLFKAVKYMDMYFKHKHSKRLAGIDIHLIGTTSIFIASKMEDFGPLDMALIHNNIAHKAFEPRDIRAMELDLLSTLGFLLPKTSILEFIQTSILQFKDDCKALMCPELEQTIQDMGRAAIFYAKMTLHDTKIQNNFESLIAAGCIYAGIHNKLHKVENSSHKELLLKWINDMSGGSDKHMAQIEGSANKIIDLERNFSKRYPHCTNLYKFNAKYIDILNE